ncbi:unnamed protein product, partial [Nesidiocoris tenuis]
MKAYRGYIKYTLKRKSQRSLAVLLKNVPQPRSARFADENPSLRTPPPPIHSTRGRISGRMKD